MAEDLSNKTYHGGVLQLNSTKYDVGIVSTGTQGSVRIVFTKPPEPPLERANVYEYTTKDIQFTCAFEEMVPHVDQPIGLFANGKMVNT